MRFQKFKGQKLPTCFKQGFQQKNGGYLQLINMANSRPGLTEEGRTLFKETKKPSAGDGLEFQTVAKW